jgi:hypothetical protein
MRAEIAHGLFDWLVKAKQKQSQGKNKGSGRGRPLYTIYAAACC